MAYGETGRLRSADLGRSREFYESVLGLPVSGEEPGEFVQLSVGDSALCVDADDGEQPPAVVFAVSGVDGLCARLGSAGHAVDGPYAAPGGRYALVRDPDGHNLVFEEETLAHDLHIRVVHAATGELLRDLTLDPTRDYQPTGAPKGLTRPRPPT